MQRRRTNVVEFILSLLVTVSIILGTLFSDANAEDFQHTTLSYLAGDCYVTRDHQRNNIWFDSIKSGCEWLLRTNDDVPSFNEQKAYIISRIAGHLGTGSHLAGQIQNVQRYSNADMGYDWFTSSGFVGRDVYYHTSTMIGNGVYIFGFTSINFGNSFTFDGFIDVSAPNNGQTQWLVQPSIIYRFNKSLSTGIEQQLYLNKVYANGLDESVPQIKLTYGW
jgi:hypothetical protein